VLSQFLGMLPNEAGTPALQILTANPPNQPPNPPQVLPRWQARSDNAFVAGGLMGSTRLSARVPNLTDGTGFSFPGAAGIIKTGSTTNTAVSATFTMGVSFGAGTANGTNGSDIDFLDFNGDGYPDVVGGSNVQPTLPNGALGSQRIGLAGQSQVRQNAQSNFDVNLGATTSNLRSGSDTFPLNIFSEQAPYNVSAGVQASQGTSAMNYDLVDVNGDGLPDLVQPTGSGLTVRLNLGYRFGQPETWNASGPVRNEQTAAFGFNAGAGVSQGFTDGVYGFGGGIASTHNMTGTDFDIIDVNGDGLPDLVTKPVSVDTVAASITSTSTAVTVNLNSGAGFLPAQQWNGALPVPIQSRATVNRNLGLHFTISIPIGPTGLFIIINPGFNHGDSFGGSRSQVRDFDGDGYADHIAINTNNDGSDATVTVHLNQRGRTNLLKSITRPLGATIALDYVRSGNTPNMPQNRWVMASRTVFDGLAGDGADFEIATFSYQNGQWNRAERTFYGFATVTEQHRDTTGVTTANIGTTTPASLPVFRSIIESFRTDSFYTKGLLTQQITQDGAGNRFLETDNTYNVVTVPNGTGVPGLNDFTDTRFPQLTQRNKLFFEGQATAGQQTSETFAYDSFGNVTNYADLGDAGTAAVFAAIGYTASTSACVTSYIVGIANSVTVTDASGNVLRKRQADVDCTTADVTENRSFLADDSVAVTDMTYDGEGKLITITGPANANGQRYSLAYTYDTTVDVYVESVTDSFSDVSNSTHDFKFGEVTSTTDENGQVVSHTYDNFGRCVTVTGPYEQVTNNNTISFSYTPGAAVPFALTSHIDTLLDPQLTGGASVTNHIQTVLFTDGLKRAVQTKKDASVSPQAGTAPTHVMTVSGRVIFDPFGRTIQQFYPVTEPTGQQGTFDTAFDTVQPTVTTYDILDRVTKVTIPDNTTTTSAYDFGADRGGQTRLRTTVIDANNVRKEMFRDVRSQITTANEFNNGGTAVFHTSYAYDPVRQITGVTDDQGNVTSVAYDLFGRRIAINSPDAGLTTFTYDLAGNLTARQTANLRTASQQITYAYQFNRVTAITYPNFPANNVTYTYGAASQRNPSLVGNVVGRITHITDGAGTEDRLYGPLGEIVSETRAIPLQGGQVPTYTTKFTFDTWNRIAQVTYPDTPNGENVPYFYDFGGLAERVHGTDDALEVDYASAIAYDKFGQRLSMTNGNGVVTTYAYRPDNRRLLNVQATLPIGYTFNNFNFTYDNVGNLLTLQNTAQMPLTFIGSSTTLATSLGNAIGGPWTKTFAYDDLYRLTSSTGTHNISATPTFTYSFSQSYDSIHNITHKTQTAMQNTAVNPQITYDNAYTYPAPGSAHPHSPTVIGEFNLTTDANGNEITKQDTKTSDVNQYLFDEENRLSCTNKGSQMPSPSCIGSNVIDFIYDHAGVRKIKSAATPTIYPNQYFTDFGGGSGNQFKHIFIGSERILTKKARIAPDREHWYYHPDHLGSTAMVTNEKSQLVDALHYFPFGEVWLEERPSSLPMDYFFTAKEFDPETGFYDFGARYLDPRFSKWMTADPALGDHLSSQRSIGGAYNPSNLSLYSYSWNNPATYYDKDGNIPLPLITGGIGAGVATLGYLGRQWYVGEKITWQGAGAAAGVGFLFGSGAALLPTATAVVGTGLTVVGGVDVARRASDYSNLSPQEQRAVKADAVLVGVGALATGASALRALRAPAAAEEALGAITSAAKAEPAAAAAEPLALPPPKPPNAPWAPGLQSYKKGNMTVAEHIFYRHGPNSGAGVSKFAQGTSLRGLRGLVNEAVAKGTRSGNGIIYDFGRVIGTDLQGKPSTILQVWLNIAGEVRTAYPR
jgi:RHS repeat-associated protein